MIMADVLKFFLIITGFLITLVCYWLLFEGLTPGRVRRAQDAYHHHPWRTLLRGILIGIPTILLGLALLNAGPAPIKFLSFALLFALTLIALLGSAGLARHVGARLHTARDAYEPWRPVLRGGTVLALCFVLPGVGWFVLLPYTLISGLGAATLALPIHEPATAIPAPADTFGTR